MKNLNSQHSMCIISYNIRYDTHTDAEYPWSFRRSHVIDLLRFHKPDIFGLQEATPGQVADVASELSDEFSWTGRPRDGGSEGEVTPLFYRTKRFYAHHDRTRWLSDDPEQPGSLGWDADVPRTVVSATLEDTFTGALLRVYNTHFDNVGRTAVANSIRLLEDWTANDWASHDADTSGAFVVLGDLNFTPEQEEYRAMSRFSRDAATYAQTLRYGPDFTYIGPGFEVSSTAGTRYDYVFVGPAVTVDTHAILTDSYRGSYPSDHLPLRVEVRLS